MTPLNQRTMKLNLTRREVCDLLIACAAAKSMANDGGTKWAALREKLKQQLEAFDKKQAEN